MDFCIIILGQAQGLVELYAQGVRGLVEFFAQRLMESIACSASGIGGISCSETTGISGILYSGFSEISSPGLGQVRVSVFFLDLFHPTLWFEPACQPSH